MAEAQVVIQATLAPMFLLSGAAIFLTYVQARLFRITDRLRELGYQLKSEPDPDRYLEIQRMRQRILRRAVILRNGTLFGVLVLAFTITTAVLLMVPSVWAQVNLDGWILTMFSAALGSFFAAGAFALWDSFLSVASARAVFPGFRRISYVDHEDD